MPHEDENHNSYKIDLTYAAILGLTVIVTAWCGLQHELWSSMLTFELKETNAAHREFTITELKERQLLMIDVIAFTQYLEAEYENNEELANYYKKNFRPEMKEAFDAWIANDPFNNPDAQTPFHMQEYLLTLDSEKANDLLKTIDEKSENADKISTIASSYVFFTTIYAGISFLEGIGRVFPSKKIQVVFLVMGIVLFSITTIILFITMPITPLHII